jgi:hypothetical protein
MSNNQRLGRFKCGGYTEVKGQMLGWWERVVFSKSPTDISFNLTQKYHHRPDLVAYDLYGRADLQWFVMQYNNISDVTTDFVIGTNIMLPTKSRLLGELMVTAPKISPL